MTATPPPNRPRAFRIPAAEPAGVAEGAVPPPTPPSQIRIVEEPFEIVEAADGTPVPVAPKSRAPWLSMLLVALGGLVSLGVGLSVERLIADLFGAAPWLGAVALVLLGVAALGLLGLVAREHRMLQTLRPVRFEVRKAAAEIGEGLLAIEGGARTGHGAAFRGRSAEPVEEEGLPAQDVSPCRKRLEGGADQIHVGRQIARLQGQASQHRRA